MTAAAFRARLFSVQCTQGCLRPPHCRPHLYPLGANLGCGALIGLEPRRRQWKKSRRDQRLTVARLLRPWCEGLCPAESTTEPMREIPQEPSEWEAGCVVVVAGAGVA